MFVTCLLQGLFTFPGSSFCGHFSVSSCLPKCCFTLQGQFGWTQNHGFLLSSQPLKKYFTAVTLLAWPLEKYLPQNHGSIHQEFVLESSYTAWAEPMLAGLWTYPVPCDRHRESSLSGEATLGTWLWWFSLLQKPVFCMFFTSRTWTCFCR